MTEEEFRAFLEKRPRFRNQIEKLIAESSEASFLELRLRQGHHTTGEQAVAAASLIRIRLATGIAQLETGTATKEEIVDSRIEKLPDDFPR